METLVIPNESDLKKWVKEAVQECFQSLFKDQIPGSKEKDDFIDRKEVAKLLKVSLVTLTDWMKRGLLQYMKRKSKVAHCFYRGVLLGSDNYRAFSTFISVSPFITLRPLPPGSSIRISIRSSISFQSLPSLSVTR
jgi:hypothetical protein